MAEWPKYTGEELRAWRKRMGFTQREAAQAVGLGRKEDICKREAGILSVRPVMALLMRELETKSLAGKRVRGQT